MFKLDITAAEGNPLKTAWDRLHKLPGGKLAFSKMIGRLAPYTGTIDGRVRELHYGYAEVAMRDRPLVRNHLDSVHAIALMNLAEMCSGCAMMYSVPPDARGILVGLSIDYFKKARGTLIAVCECDPPQTSERAEYVVDVQIYDADKQRVCEAHATWLIGPKSR